MEIAKALSKKVQLLILDEPTASLNETDSDALLDLLMEFKRAGHHLDPDLAQAQRDLEGRRLDHHPARRRHGRDAGLPHRQPSAKTASSGAWSAARWPTATRRAHAKIGETVFEVKDWNVYHPLHADRQLIKNVNLKSGEGEIVGIAGLMGAGRTEFAMSVFGRSYGQKISGEVLLHGKQVDVSTIRQGDRRTASPMSPKTASTTAWC